VQEEEKLAGENAPEEVTPTKSKSKEHVRTQSKRWVKK